MKKTIMIFLLLAVGMLSAQTKFSEFKVGLINPANANSGFFGGLTFGRAIDDNIAVGMAVDFYRSSYTKETKIKDAKLPGGGTETEYVTELEQSTTMLPLFFQIQYQGPIARQINLRVTGGLGYEFLWSSFKNFNTQKDETKFYSGFGWHIDLGLAYELSRASDIYTELVYHSGAPARDRGTTDAGLPTRTEIDMSGLGIRLGIRIYNFGF